MSKKKLAFVLAAVMVFMTSVTSFAAESILSEAENDIQAEVAEEISANDAVPLSAEEEGGTTGEMRFCWPLPMKRPIIPKKTDIWSAYGIFPKMAASCSDPRQAAIPAV
ncbi:MAG: hypothetical protein MJ063_08030 [Lachnospiraceae bacterium]|nr:hypothetical protein [Lachnospiraceae bacterium]